MLIDARTLEAEHVIEADVCIVGSGPAGLTLARELSAPDRRVCLLESGGVDFEPRTQALAEGQIVGEPTNCLDGSRRRQYGGTLHLWDSQLGGGVIGMRCGALDPIDFESRDWVPHSGWPFDHAEMDPFYERANRICRLGPCEYRGDAWESPEFPQFRAGDAISSSVWQFGAQETFAEYMTEVERAEDITACLHANVTEIETDETASNVTALHAATLEGNCFRVRAKVYVLAAGGFENARLLLLSDSVQQNGLGNGHDLVGRFYMDHPIANGGSLVPRDRQALAQAGLYDVRTNRDTVVMGKLHLTPEVQRQEQLLNGCMLLLPKHGTFKPEVMDSLKLLLRSGLRRQLPDEAPKHFKRVARGLDFVAVSVARKLTRNKSLFPQMDWGPTMTQGAGWSAEPQPERRFTEFEVYLFAEQPPDARSRVMLGEETDALGCRRIHLDWRWDELSRRSIARTEERLRAEFARSGWGALRKHPEHDSPQLQFPSQHHHLGTTRLHPDPKQGVVDADSRVHGVSNLFVTGGSVFPTGGYINPTLTIVALATRLADHLERSLAHAPRVASTAEAG